MKCQGQVHVESIIFQSAPEGRVLLSQAVSLGLYTLGQHEARVGYQAGTFDIAEILYSVDCHGSPRVTFYASAQHMHPHVVCTPCSFRVSSESGNATPTARLSEVRHQDPCAVTLALCIPP